MSWPVPCFEHFWSLPFFLTLLHLNSSDPSRQSQRFPQNYPKLQPKSVLLCLDLSLCQNRLLESYSCRWIGYFLSLCQYIFERGWCQSILHYLCVHLCKSVRLGNDLQVDNS